PYVIAAFQPAGQLFFGRDLLDPYHSARRFQTARLHADEIHAAPEHVSELIVSLPGGRVAAAGEPAVSDPSDATTAHIEDVEHDLRGRLELETHERLAARRIRLRRRELHRSC